MLLAPTPLGEAVRLRSLHDLLILDTPPEERFDRIVRFAAEEFSVPIALISLVDENRQWFKSKVGLDVCETDRGISFCGHAIHESDAFIIPDATADQRFHDNPLVTGAPFVRFYAGAPLRLATGSVVGTLCLLDTSARTFDALDRGILLSLRDLVAQELQRRALSS